MESFRKTIVEEPLHELSKGTLKRYVKKAAETAVSASQHTGEYQKISHKVIDKRLHGIHAASRNLRWKKLKNEEVTLTESEVTCPACGGDGGELGTLGNLKHYRCRDCGIGFHHKVKPTKKKVRKVTKEEVEQIDEAKRHLPPSKYLKRYGKRFKGIRQATSTLTKEEVELTLDTTLTPEQFQNLIEANRSFSLSASDKHVHLAQNAEHEGKWGEAKRHWKNAALASIKHDAVHKRDRADKLKVRGLTMRKEGVETLEEKDTLNKRYAKDYHDSLSGQHDGSEDFNDHASQVHHRISKKPGYDEDKFQHHLAKLKGGSKQMSRINKQYRKHKNTDARDMVRHGGKWGDLIHKKDRKSRVDEAVELHTSRKDALVKLLSKAGARALPPKKKVVRT
jgi:hypothetical protein